MLYKARERSILLDSDQQKTGKWQTIYKPSIPPNWKVENFIRHLLCLYNKKQLKHIFVCVWLIKQLFKVNTLILIICWLTFG